MNGINVQTSLHEEVVKILTESGETVKLVAYREKIINKKMKPMSQINGVDPNNAGKPSDPNNKVCDLILNPPHLNQGQIDRSLLLTCNYSFSVGLYNITDPEFHSSPQLPGLTWVPF